MELEAQIRGDLRLNFPLFRRFNACFRPFFAKLNHFLNVISFSHKFNHLSAKQPYFGVFRVFSIFQQKKTI